MEKIAFGVDLAGVEIEELDEWLKENKGLDKDPDVKKYQLLHTVYAYKRWLLQAKDKNMLLRPTVLDFYADYHLEPKPVE